MAHWFFLLLYISGCFLLNAYARKHPPLYKEKLATPGGHSLKIIFAVWGASLWPMLALLWILVPAIKATWTDLASPIVPYLFLALGAYVPLLIFLALLAWLNLSNWGGVVVFTLLPLSLIWVLASAKIVSQFPYMQLLPFLFFISMPPLFSIFLLVGWIQKLIPVETGEEQGHRNSLRLLLSFFTAIPKPSWVIEKGKIKNRIKGHALMGTGPGWVMTEPENAVVLKGRSEIRRIAGPGGIFTRNHKEEGVYTVVDLRPQFHSTTIDAITQDGIEIALCIRTVFRIDPGMGNLRLRQRWPYARGAAWRAVFAAEVNPQTQNPLEPYEPCPWEDIPIERSRTLIRQMMMDYSLDALYAAPPTYTLPRLQISAFVHGEIQARLAPQGFHIESWSISNIVPKDEAVTQQRIQAWKARWIRQFMEWRGEMQAQRIEKFAMLREKVRFDLLSGMIEHFNKLLRENADTVRANLLVYYLIENLASIAREPDIQAVLPKSALMTLEQLEQQQQQSLPPKIANLELDDQEAQEETEEGP